MLMLRRQGVVLCRNKWSAITRPGSRPHLLDSPLHQQDATTCAAIVTCGGLCPGENVAIRLLPGVHAYCLHVAHSA